MRTSYYSHVNKLLLVFAYANKLQLWIIFKEMSQNFGLPQNDIGVGSGRVGRAFALHELAEGYYLLLAMIRFVQNSSTNPES